jgi:threonine/homoserine/homoserine lactone efflux protein
MGAISPGPSLAVVIRNTISGGRVQGVMTGVGHGIGLGIYAFIAVMGLSSVLFSNECIFNTLQLTGALVLMWIAYNMITHRSVESSEAYESSGGRGFIEGFMIAFLNPKILVFLVAVFSQFINSGINASDRMIIAVLAGVIDTTWYVLVALILTGTSLIDQIRVNAVLIDCSIGVILVVIAVSLIVKTLGLNIF